MATNWQAAENEYIHGSFTYGEIARRYGVNEPAVRQYARRHDWKKKRRDLSQNVAENAQAIAIERRVNQLTQLNQDDIKISQAIRAQIAKVLSKAAIEDKTLTPAELRSLTGAHESAQRVVRLALGASTENKEFTGAGGESLIPKNELTVEEYLRVREEALKKFDRLH